MLKQSIAKPKVYTHCDVMIWFLAEKYRVGHGVAAFTNWFTGFCVSSKCWCTYVLSKNHIH